MYHAFNDRLEMFPKNISDPNFGPSQLTAKVWWMVLPISYLKRATHHHVSTKKKFQIGFMTVACWSQKSWSELKWLKRNTMSAKSCVLLNQFWPLLKRVNFIAWSFYNKNLTHALKRPGFDKVSRSQSLTHCID